MEAISDKLEYIPAGQASGAGLFSSTWSYRIKNPEFRTRDQFREKITEMDEVEARELYLLDLDKQEADSVDGYKAIRSKKTGKVYSVRSGKYVPVQDHEIAEPFVEALDHLGLEVEGRIDGVGTGRTVGHFLIRDKDYEIDFGNGKHDWVDTHFLGIRFDNSFTGTSAFGGAGFAIRKVCTNYALVPEFLGEFRHSHMGDLSGITKEFENLVLKMADRIPILQEAIRKAEEIEVGDNLADLLWGAGLPVTAIDDIVKNPKTYVPELTGNLNMNHGFKASTAWISYRTNSGISLPGMEKMSKDAVNLLTQDYDKLVKRGIDRREKYEAELKKAMERREAKDRAMYAEVQAGLRRE